MIYYLNCPYNEKGEAKSLRAQYDGACKKWIVPAERYDTIETFNKWHPDGKICLYCPYDEKDEVKALGARWDRNVKKWFVPGLENTKKQVPAKLQKWLPSPTPDRSPKKKVASAVVVDRSPAKKVPRRAQKGSKDDVTLPRVNPSMTVGQLQDECRLRDIKGISGKTKDWYLE
jgi:hypothetical protein